MWRRHQAVQSSVQRWLLCGHYSRKSVSNQYQPLSTLRCFGGAASYAVADNILLLQKPSLLSALPSHTRYGHVHQRISNPLLISCHAYSSRRPRVPRMKDLHSVEEVIITAYEYLDVMSRRDISAVWARIALLMTKRQPRQRGKSSNSIEEVSFEGMEHMLCTIFDNTTDGIERCGMRELTETTLGMAKIVKILHQQGNRRGDDNYRVILRRLLIDKDKKPNRDLFKFLANASVDKLHQFDARHISNLAYAYALIEYVPKFDDGSDLFDHIAKHSVGSRAHFDPQGLSNMVWAYATVDKPHDALFEAMGDEIVASKHLKEFRPQALSNTVWAYATAGINHPRLFETVTNHIVKSRILDQFSPQALANTVWAYATAGINDPKLFKTVASHIVKSDHLDRFNPQNLANTLWAFSTAGINYAKLFEALANHIVQSGSFDRFSPQNLANAVWAYATAGINHPKLFEKVGNHIVESDIVNRFNPQGLSNTVWSYATAEVSHPELFERVAAIATQRKDLFNPQEIANLLWACATMGIIDKQLFSSFVPTAAKLVDSFNNQDVANVAWAYTVADVDAPTLFNDLFINKCVVKRDGFEAEALRQLYQWHLWQTKEKSSAGLPQDLLDRSYTTFISEDPTVSKLQDDVVSQLTSIGFDPREEVLMGSGYRIDALVEVNRKTVGVEVDGQSHFIGKGRSPTGSTILKRRQVPAIDGIELVSVPYWDWNKLGKSQTKKQAYLRKLLGLAEDISVDKQ